MSILLAAAALAARLSLGGVTIGEPVLDVVHRLGPPDHVQTGDTGHEWRWYDKNGLDREILTDDALIVREIRVARPLPLDHTPAKLVQPREIPVLEQKVDKAAATAAALGATLVPQRESSVRGWRLDGGVLVGEVGEGRLMRLLALDDEYALRLGYLPGGTPPEIYHAPRYITVGTVGYPRRAADAHIGGIVVVRIEIDATGALHDVRVILSSGNADLDNAEIASIRQSTFRPALCDDVPCPGVLLDREEYIP